MSLDQNTVIIKVFWPSEKAKKVFNVLEYFANTRFSSRILLATFLIDAFHKLKEVERLMMVPLQPAWHFEKNAFTRILCAICTIFHLFWLLLLLCMQGSSNCCCLTRLQQQCSLYFLRLRQKTKTVRKAY